MQEGSLQAEQNRRIVTQPVYIDLACIGEVLASLSQHLLISGNVVATQIWQWSAFADSQRSGSSFEERTRNQLFRSVYVPREVPAGFLKCRSLG